MISYFAYSVPAVVLFAFLVVYFKNKINNLTQEKETERAVIEFHCLMVRFTIETNFRKKVDYAAQLQYQAEKNKKPDTLLPFGYLSTEQLQQYLTAQIVGYLVTKTAGMSVIKTVAYLQKAFEEMWSSEYINTVPVSALLKEFALVSDLGFLKTLQGIYGAEQTSQAKERFEAAKHAYETFTKKYRMENASTANHFYNLEQELTQQGDSAIKLIAQHWIMRSGKPSALMYRKLEQAVEGGYDDEEVFSVPQPGATT